MTARLFTDGTPARALFSFGGGVQSHAVLALAAQGVVQYDAFVFANVGHDSENPDTLAYIETVTKPFCATHGLTFVEVAKPGRTLYQDVLRQDRASFPIPAFNANGGQLFNACTHDWKIRVVDQWIRDQGWPHVVIGLGISLDEFHRSKDTNWHDRENDANDGHRYGFWKRREFPLLDLRLRRTACYKAIRDAGLPTPARSACFFCPNAKLNEWKRLRQTRPDLFDKAETLEQAINSRGKESFYSLTRTGLPLADAVADQKMLAFPPEDDRCDSGYCFT